MQSTTGFSPATAMMQRVTGSKIDPAPYVRYLQSKYGEIYGL